MQNALCSILYVRYVTLYVGLSTTTIYLKYFALYEELSTQNTLRGTFDTLRRNSKVFYTLHRTLQELYRRTFYLVKRFTFYKELSTKTLYVKYFHSTQNNLRRPLYVKYFALYEGISTKKPLRHFLYVYVNILFYVYVKVISVDNFE